MQRQMDSQESKFIGTGNLISDKHVLTVANHIHPKRQSEPSQAQDFTIILGVHDLSEQYEYGIIYAYVNEMKIHPDWDPNSDNFDANIALIELNGNVNFNEFIQPICLWNFDFKPPTDDGIIVGYGKSEDETKEHENIPKKTRRSG